MTISKGNPAATMEKVSSGTAFTNGICQWLWCGTAGTATIVTETDDTLTDFPLLQGANPIRAKTVTLGTALDVWGAYGPIGL